MLFRNVSLWAICLVCASAPAMAQSMSGVTIGSDRAALNQLGTKPTSTQAMGPHTAVKFHLPGGNELSATFLRSTGKIVYLETDWGGEPGGAFSDFEGLKYGHTSLADIRRHFGHNGMMFDARQGVSMLPDGGVALFNSYEISGSDVIATFVTTISAAALAELQARHGNEKLSDHIGPAAKLNALILAERNYVDTIWGAKKTYDQRYAPIIWGAAQSGSAPTESKADADVIRPDQFPITDIFTGKTKLPDFKGRDKAFNNFRTRIRNGLQEGPNFAGEYSVIQIGCGAGCSFVIVGNNRTGQPLDFPRGGEDNMYLTLKYQLTSKLMIAQWADYDQSTCFIEHFQFDGSNWTVLAKRDVGPVEACYNEIRENLD
ncbi:hypothetical protein CN155_08220 [Sinorhizobium meliloti]|uniref:hypothetical protein n=1 Tax=Rhizobium meliloti TaxID=382 RepID=UPI000FDC9CD8|nr:hypothetical protein [Sinorhizobium meliloti]RVK59251.1 hypothetical protein CN155_08220 [Sinorhizobium meliloti]